MPEIIALAYRIACLHVESVALFDEELRQHPDALDETIALLRQVWNARGAADLAATELPEVLEMRGFDNAEETHELIQRALRRLDR